VSTKCQNKEDAYWQLKDRVSFKWAFHLFQHVW